MVLIDELAHTNIEGSAHTKRFQDVLQILEADIDVLSTLNIQHVESITPRVQSLTGITVRETVPDWVLDRADEIVLSDLTPEALVHRMSRGDIYPPERAERALANFFRRGNLIALREMALQRVTRAVDRTLDDYVKRKTVERALADYRAGGGVHQRQLAVPRPDRAGGAHGGGDERGILCHSRGDRDGDAGETPEIARGQYSVCRECRRQSGAAEGQAGALGDRGLRREEPDHAGHLRPVGGEGMAEVSVLPCSGAVHV